jgi:integrase
MARPLNRLTVADVKSAIIGKTIYDGGGLECVRTSADSVKWIFQYTSPVTRKRRERSRTGLTLKAARDWAGEQRDMVRQGKDPLIEADAQAATQRALLVATDRESNRKAATLEAIAREYHRTLAPKFRNRKHAAQWIASLEGNLPPSIWRQPISEIEAGELLDVMLKLRERVPETARRVRQRLEAVFADAALRKLCDNNPAALIAHRMKGKQRGPKPHFRALHYRDVPRFVQALRQCERVSVPVKLALELTIVCASRSGEVRGMRWDEVDLKAKIWTVPAARMKGAEEHRVHLPPRAIAILEAAKALRPADKKAPLVFPAPRDGTRQLSDMTLTMALRRIPTGDTRNDDEPETYGDLATVHGFRSAFSTWANDGRVYHSDVIEAALAHTEADRVRAAYNRSAREGDRFERDLRALRNAWADYVCSTQHDVVVALRGRAGRRVT